MPFEPISDDRLSVARQLLDEGKSYAAVKEATGISYPTLRKYFGKPDPKPGGPKGSNRKAIPSKPAPTDDQLTRTFTKVAVFPAVPAGLLLHCEYCATHFAEQGPNAAVKLVELSRDNPALRDVLNTIYAWGESAAWATLLATYIGVPVMHHAAPEFVYRWAAPVMGMPPSRGRAHEHTPTPASNGASPPPGPNPYTDVDTETLLRMAETMGIRVEPITDAEVVTDDTEPAEASSPAPAETVTADPNAS